MDFIKKYGWVITSGLMIALLIAVFIRRNDGPTAVQKAFWNDYPLVVNCFDSPYTLEEVNEAVDFWEELDHVFLDVLDDYNCPGYPVTGLIQITSSSQSSLDMSKLGHGNVFYDKDTKEIQSAIVSMFFKSKLILFHEIGHAIGYEDNDIEGHIMYFNIENLGTGTSGLKRKHEYSALE